MSAVGVVAMLLGAAVSIGGSIPEPYVHDEFSYLLAADTFAHGRLTNPPHPRWQHFESYHIIQQPTYASKYQAGQGLTLAVGQVLFGLPIVGVWLGIAFASAAVCWMLLAWVSPRWALAGGLLTAMHPQIMRWDHTYWGGGVPMIGGALLIGAARRLAVPEPRGRDAAVLAVGLAVLANSRPFEGLVLSMAVLGPLLHWHLTRAPNPVPLVSRVKAVAVPLVVVLGVTAAMMGYYNFRVTGHPLRLPYLVHETTYSEAPIFFWQPERRLTYRHDVMREFWTNGWGAPGPDSAKLAAHSALWVWAYRRLFRVAMLFESLALNWGVVLPLVIVPWSLWRDPWMRVAVLSLALSVAAILMESWTEVHYLAPMVPLAIAIVVRAMSQLSVYRTGRVLLLVAAVLSVAACAREYGRLVSLDARNAEDWSAERSGIRASLIERGGTHLVIVRYSRPLGAEWVYNEADIDGAPVVWAREMDIAENRKLLDYFRGRQAWLLEADAPERKLTPYPSPASP